MLFEHTRKLRERKQMLNRTPVLKRERDQLSSPANDPTSIVRQSGDHYLLLKRAMTSAHQRLITDYAHNVVDPDSEEEEPPMEADKIAVADYYLGKWTTVLEKVREKNGVEITKEGEENPRKEDEENPSKEDEENPRPIRRVTIEEAQEV